MFNKRFTRQVNDMQRKTAELAKRRDVLKNLDLFVLDNSLRETTVGQLRGHTIENKWKIYDEVCFLTYMQFLSTGVIFRVFSSYTQMQEFP